MLRRHLMVRPSATQWYNPLPGSCSGMWSTKMLISFEAANKKIDVLEAKRTALEQQLAAPGIDKDEKHDINQRIIALDNQITALYALYGRLPNLPGPKTVKFLDEDGEEKSRRVDAANFERWLGGNALVPVPLDRDGDAVTAAAPTLGFMCFDDIDEDRLYYLSNNPLDINPAYVQHLVDVRKLEFGKKCKELLGTSPAFNKEKYTVVESAQGGSRNPFAYRPSPSSPVEVDFFAKNGSHSVAGMFQLTMPRDNKKITNFFNTCQALDPPATKFIFGVSLANPAELARLKKKNFDAILVRCATGFHLMQ